MTETRADSAHASAPEGRTVALGGGVRVPYPTPQNQAATRVGKGNKRTGTKPELLLRSNLHRRGLRFRKDFLIRAAGRRVQPDVVFTRARVAVFVDGCFWHGCPDHQVAPKSNTDYWVPKLRRNAERDRQADEVLTAEGWAVAGVGARGCRRRRDNRRGTGSTSSSVSVTSRIRLAADTRWDDIY